MLLVCLSHFAEVYTLSSGVSLYWIYNFTMIAAPTFVIISGILLGFFYVSKKDSFNLIKRNFINRGIFILFFGKLIICLAFTLRAHSFSESLKYIHITDVVGINIIFGPILISLIQPIYRITLGIGSIIFTWIIIAFWMPSNQYLEIIKEAVFGSFEYKYFHTVFPVLPWFGLYFISSYFGEKLGSSVEKEKLKIIYFMKVGLCSITVAASIKLIFWLLKYYTSWPEFKSFTIWALTSPLQKWPPSIVYFLFYGGIGLLFIGFFLYIEQKKWLENYLNITAIIGRSSLFVFIVQYYFYYMILFAMHLYYSLAWPVYFMFSICCIFLLARVWDSMKLNRFLTLGAIYNLIENYCAKHHTIQLDQR